MKSLFETIFGTSEPDPNRVQVRLYPSGTLLGASRRPDGSYQTDPVGRKLTSVTEVGLITEDGLTYDLFHTDTIVVAAGASLVIPARSFTVHHD